MLLGLVAAQTVLDRSDSEMSDLRGRWHDIEGIPARVTYHPLAVHRRPNLMTGFLADWQAALAATQLAVPAVPTD
jgi:uracil-DNA glycosylase